MYKLYNGDCLEIMDRLIEEGVKVDCVITDLPYGITARNKWDNIIPLNIMWEKLNNLVKENGTVALFCSQPFTTKLINSNFNSFKYEWIWEKNNSTGFMNANKMPLRKHENIAIFYKKQCTYNPQGLIPCNKINKRGKVGLNYNDVNSNEYIQKYTNYPTQILKFSYDKERFHPTQNPGALLEYLIKTYTNENELILDFTMGSGSTGVACMNTNRKFIGIELDENYFNIAKDRKENSIKNKYVGILYEIKKTKQKIFISFLTISNDRLC